MIVWLASYPRSGNTLLRQVLKQCFGLESCEGLESIHDEFRKPNPIHEAYFGAYFATGDSETFYHKARTNSELVLIKTHQAPRDTAKAIHIIRDGRLALQSFLRFQEAYHPGSSTFESLLVGHHPYGDWTNHYRVWSQKKHGPTLVIRFEALVNADAALLDQIGTFLGVGQPIKLWTNPQSNLQAHDPIFFGGGGLQVWQPNSFWTPPRLRAFHSLHGPLMVELGYADQAEVASWKYTHHSAEYQALQTAFQQAVHGLK